MNKPRSHSICIVALILLTSLSVSLIGWQYARQSSLEYATERFDMESDHLYQQIRARFSAYEQVLRGGVGLFDSSDHVTRDEWRSYVDILTVKDNFPGIQGIGFSQWIGDYEALGIHQDNMHEQGYPGYRVKPQGARSEYTSIIYLEPFDDRNRQAFGYDMFSEVTRREAMQRARDSGNAALSGKVELIQEITVDKQAGFLLYLPVYTSGERLSSVEGRRSALFGFVYSPFRANDLMGGILEKESSSIGFQIYDQTPAHTNSLLYDGMLELGLNTTDNPAMLTSEKQVSIAGRQWTIRFSSTPVFETVYSSTAATAVLSIGVLLSLLIASIAWMLVSARLRVAKRTGELRIIEQANTQLIEATRIAQSANQAKSSFLAAMSHEIRTPMNGVVGMVEVMLNESPSTQQASSLKIVLNSANTLLEIIDDILDFSKIEAGHLEMEKTEESLSTIVDDVVGSMVPQAVKSGVIVSQFIDPDVPELVRIDALRFRQILTNLIGNAVKFSGYQEEHVGRVWIRVSRTPANASSIQIDIIDNGIGIEQNAIDAIFDSFVQAESSTTRRFGGSGLGLAICQRLVSIMEGKISVSSEIGQGSVFSVVLPLVAVQEHSVAPYENISDVNCVIAKGTDYIADDLKTYLQAAGAIVQIEPTIDEAFQTISTFREPAVLLYSDSNTSFFADLKAQRYPDIRYVVLSRCRGRRVLKSTNIVQPESAKQPASALISSIGIQLDGLSRRTLIETVAIAAGRASPEVMQTLVEQPVQATAAPLNRANAMAAGTLILVAEDDCINQKVLYKQLSLLGFTAEFAKNGEEALALWRENKYGMVFTDLHMPQMDGYQLTAAIRGEEAHGDRIPIVALTANALRGEVKRAVKAGIDEYLTKPIKLLSLQQTIEQYLSSLTSESGKLDELRAEEAIQTINDTTVFDHAVLPDLLGQDDDAIAECLHNYIQLLDDKSEILAIAVSDNDKPVTKQISHRLISTSFSVGALQLGEICRNLEQACDDKQTTLTESHAHRLIDAMDRVKHEVSVKLKVA